MSDLLELAAGSCRATIDPAAGGRLTSFVVDGHELMVQSGRDTYHWGSFVMAPWVGRLRDGAFTWHGETHAFPRNAAPHALHGLVTDAAWHVDGPGTVSIELPEPWPWRGRLVHATSLFDDHATFRLELQADEPMPAAIGWHPWFRRTLKTAEGALVGPIGIDAKPGRMYGNDDTGLPTGALVEPAGLPWDYAFVDLAAPPRVTWPGILELRVELNCPIYVLYDQEPEGVCIEPWTAPPNSLNLPEPQVVTPGQPLVATMTWRWRRLGGGRP